MNKKKTEIDQEKSNQPVAKRPKLYLDPVLDLQIADRKAAINSIIDKVEAQQTNISSSELRMIASDKLTQMVRSDRFILKMCKLIRRETTRQLFIDDDTQPTVEGFAYEAIREILWRTAQNVGVEEAREIMESAIELVEMEFE
ncbi:MAG: hypothetical protein ACRYGP_26710 [Janthinobacterium lividum]